MSLRGDIMGGGTLPPDPDENPADVLTDAIGADPNKITAADINALYARLDNAITGVTKPAPVLQLVPRDDDE